MRDLTAFGPLEHLLTRRPPEYLYHYTGPAGAIGILQSQKLWAGRPADMNDASEQLLAHQFAADELTQLEFPRRSFGEGMTEYALEFLGQGREFWREKSAAYTVSLTSARDSLEQWRAYCPRSGGVALGFRSSHLRNVAADQGFILAPCTYEQPVQKDLVKQIVQHHLQIWHHRRPLESPRQGISGHLVHSLISDLERYAPLIKHSSFSAEQEWRLISPHRSESRNTSYVHIPGPSGIKQFQEFALLTDAHPAMPPGQVDPYGWESGASPGFHPVIGPSLDAAAMAEALRALTPESFGWLLHIDRTTSPYR